MIYSHLHMPGGIYDKTLEPSPLDELDSFDALKLIPNGIDDLKTENDEDVELFSKALALP